MDPRDCPTIEGMELDQLSSLLGSDARARLIAYFVANPEARRHVRALGRLTGIGKRSLQAELERLEKLRLVSRKREGRRVLYIRSGHSPQWQAMERLVASYGIPTLLRAALAEVPGVKAAFLFGSLARGDAREDSDVDLLVYGDGISAEDLGRATLDLGVVLQRPLDVKEYDTERFVRANDPAVSFLPAALAGPKVWLVGAPERLPSGEGKAG
jgi:predicted nucleotidyltransferase